MGTQNGSVKYILFLFTVIFLATNVDQVRAQYFLSELPNWENPKVIGENKEPAHATFVTYPSIPEALADSSLTYQSTYHQSLDGQWKFKWSENPESRPTHFFQTNYDVSSWDNITVPGPWQVQGFGKAIYLNIQYPMQSLMGGLFPPRAPREYNPVGSYRRTFNVPSEWDGRQVFINFEGVKSAFYLWINGEKVGYSEGSMTPAEFNITPFLKNGDNTLAVEVYRWSDASWLEDQDMWRFSGIFRGVHLHSRPNIYLEDFFVRAGLDSEYEDGTLHITAEVRNNTNDMLEPLTVEAHLFDQQGKRVSDDPIATARTQHELASGILSQAQLRETVTQPQKWTAETPNLYTIVLVLKDNDGQVIETARTVTGFREIEIRDNMFMVNGREVKLKGTNLHDHDPITGRTVDIKTMLKDVKLMKQHNLNAVRMSHYPHDRKYYELFDKYGLYVVDEANVESHGISFHKNLLPGSDPQWTDAIIDRARSMVEANKNHPSVVIWSMGNEAGSGDNFSQMASYIRTSDPSRPIHYQHYNEVTDFHSDMYPTVTAVQQMVNDPDITKPIFLCEYVHSMGNSTGNLDEYMELMDNNRNFVGAFIWDWADQGLRKENSRGEMFWAYGGDYGDDPNDGNFNFNGVVFPDRKPQPALQKVKYSYQHVKIGDAGIKDGRIWISNNYSHINLDKFTLRWSLNEDGSSIQNGSMDAPSLKPGERTTIELPLETPNYEAGREYWLNISLRLSKDSRWADKGFSVAREQMKMPYAVPQPDVLTTDGSSPLQVTQGNEVIQIGNESFNVEISRNTGALQEYTYKENSLINGPLVPNYWRATTDNDRAGWRNQLEPWQEAAQKRSVTSVEITGKQPNRTEVTVKGTLPVGESTYQTVYTILGNGTLQVDQTLNPIGVNIPEVVPKVGMELRIPGTYSTMSWYGRGPEENYSDRKQGIPVGTYSGPIDSLWVNYPYPQENGNRTDVRWVAFTNNSGNGLLAVANKNLNVSAWPFTLQDLVKATHIDELPHRNFYTVNLDYKQQGVGGTNTWSRAARALPEYRLPTSQSYSYRFYLRPYTSEMGELRNVANLRFPQE